VRATVPVPLGSQSAAVPVPPPTGGKWSVCEVGGKWAAVQPWATPVYWLRYFDTFAEAYAFVQQVMAKEAIQK
jgi:hypothetical protein